MLGYAYSLVQLISLYLCYAGELLHNLSGLCFQNLLTNLVISYLSTSAVVSLAGHTLLGMYQKNWSSQLENRFANIWV